MKCIICDKETEHTHFDYSYFAICEDCSKKHVLNFKGGPQIDSFVDFRVLLNVIGKLKRRIEKLENENNKLQ